MMNELVYFQHGGENISAKTDASSQAEKNETTSSRRASTNVPSAKENTMVDAKLSPAPEGQRATANGWPGATEEYQAPGQGQTERRVASASAPAKDQRTRHRLDPLRQCSCSVEQQPSESTHRQVKWMRAWSNKGRLPLKPPGEHM